MFYQKDAEGQMLSQDEEEGDPLILEEQTEEEEQRQPATEKSRRLNNSGSNRSQKPTSSNIFGKPARNESTGVFSDDEKTKAVVISRSMIKGADSDTD